MSEIDLSPIEARMAARIAPQPSTALRERVMGRLETARRRERAVNLAAVILAVGSCAVGIALNSTSPRADVYEDRGPLAEPPAQLAERLGLDARELERVNQLLANACVPRIAPPRGSIVLDFEEGL